MFIDGSAQVNPGVILTLLSMSLLASLLYGVSGHDPLALVGAASSSSVSRWPQLPAGGDEQPEWIPQRPFAPSRPRSS